MKLGPPDRSIYFFQCVFSSEDGIEVAGVVIVALLRLFKLFLLFDEKGAGNLTHDKVFDE